MRFGDPSQLQWLWALALTASLLLLLARRRRAQLGRFLPPAAFARLAPGARIGRRIVRLCLWLLAVTSLIVALARPQWGLRWEQVRTRGLDILVLLDTSRSMLAADFKPSRLQQAKWGLRELAQRLQGDRIGLVPFAGAAFLLCPLTTDYAAFLMSVEDANIGSVPRGGTAIAAALRVAVETFDKESIADRVILLVTDGEDHEGNLDRWLPALKERKIRIFAIGVGTPEGEPLPAPDGAPGFQKDAAGNIILSALREEPLQMLARETGGTYIRAAPGDLGLDKLISDHLSNLVRAESESRLSKTYEEQAGWFIAFGLLLLAAESALRERGGRDEG
ncbi:MAG: VWA domain-containing protein [Kiritimatiellae bacterium]|nr:VWA domain-containing protein [Kiritimatiellia bacterium]MDW8459138.1 VWA domain-containing protein [Verrucomicrobiota bacterium]